MLPKILHRWIPLAIVIVLLCGLMYGVAQQVIRQTANDPQIQMAQDIAGQLYMVASTDVIKMEGSIDIAKSLAPFFVVYDSTGTPLTWSGRLNHKVPVPPTGVFEYTLAHGEDRITWEPEEGVRIAAVVVRVSSLSTELNNSFVLAGRSLRETERRIHQIGKLSIAALAFSLFVSLGVVALVEAVSEKRKKRAI